MIELILIAIETAKMEQAYQEKREALWQEQFQKADPQTKKHMLEQKEKDRLEAIAERRHREQIRAQEKIADAIRSSSFWRF